MTRPGADPLAWLDDEAEERRNRGLVRRLEAFGPGRPGRIGNGAGLVNFAANDYLGLAADPRVIEAAARSAATHGWGAGASPLVCGWRDDHEALAADLAEFEQVEAALLFPSGFAANLGSIAGLAGPGDAVYLDRLAHSCLVSGARLSGAALRVFPHNDAVRLRAILGRDAGRYRRSLIATEGVFSMDGDLAPLAELSAVAETCGAMLLVDEAHATGVVGPDGRGASAACGVADRIDVRVGTLSKALGSIGGFVAGSRRLIDHLTHRAPTFAYSTAMPPAAAAAARAALAIARNEPDRHARVLALADRLRAGLHAIGFDPGDSATPIVPILLGHADRTMATAASLRDRGFLVGAIRPPTVPSGTSRLRLSLSAAHSPDDVDFLLDALAASSANPQSAIRNPQSEEVP